MPIGVMIYDINQESLIFENNKLDTLFENDQYTNKFEVNLKSYLRN